MPVPDDFDSLVESGTAVVLARSTGDTGTAFRIAPRYVLTAGHVVGRDGLGTEVDLDFREAGRCVGKVVALSRPPAPDGRFWPFPDLCVIEIPERACPDARCVYVAEPVFSSTDRVELRLMGMSGAFHELLPLTTDTVEFDRYDKPFLKFSDRIVRPGRSGCPLYSRRLGLVAGMVKASGDVVVPDGGLATPILAGLRALGERDLYREIVAAHDAYHRDHPSWLELAPADGDVQARQDHMRLVGLLAELPDPPSGDALAEMYQRICPAAPDRPAASRLLHPRDLAELIFAEHDDPETLALLYANLAAIPGASAELEDLALGATGGLVSTGRLVSLVGVISEQPSAQQDGQAYLAELFTIWKRPRPDRPEEETGPARPERGYRAQAAGFPAAKAALQALIDRYLANSEDTVELIEIALPDDQLGAEKLHSWQRNPRNAHDPRMLREFGRLQLRRTATWPRYAEQRKILRDHWRSLERATDADHGLFWLHCRDNPGAARLHQSLLSRHGVGVLVPPSQALLDQLAEFDPRPVLVWRRCECAEHDATAPECPGSRFRAALGHSFRSLPANSWFASVDRVQTAVSESALEPADEGAGWAEIVYVLERPGHHRSQVYLAGPATQGSEE